MRRYRILLALLITFIFFEKSSFPSDIIYVSNVFGSWELFKIDPLGNKSVRLTENSIEEKHPSWAKDEKRVVFATNLGDIRILNLDTGKIEEVFTLSKRADQPCFHPEGDKLSYVGYSFKEGETSDIFMAYLKRKKDRVKGIITTRFMETFPAWSPDGLKLIYSLFYRRGLNVVEDLWIHDFRSDSGFLILKNGFQNIQADFSPDGSMIVFASNMSGNFDIWIMALNRGFLKRLTYYPGYDGDPCFSPDGKRVAFVSSRSGRRHIWIMDLDGSDKMELTKGMYECRDPDW